MIGEKEYDDDSVAIEMGKRKRDEKKYDEKQRKKHQQQNTLTHHIEIISSILTFIFFHIRMAFVNQRYEFQMLRNCFVRLDSFELTARFWGGGAEAVKA